MISVVRRLLLILTASSAFSLTCSAMDLSAYQKIRPGLDNDPANGMYIVGLGKGVFWANTVVKLKKQPPLFCPPAKLRITGDFVISLLNEEIDQAAAGGHPHAQNEDIELVMVMSFLRRFPCPEAP